MKKFTLLVMTLLAFTTLLSAAGQHAPGSGSGAAASVSIPDYINLNGYIPVVKQGVNVPMTLSWSPGVGPTVPKPQEYLKYHVDYYEKVRTDR